MFKEWRQSWNFLEPRSFDTYMNATTPMITMLDCLEIDTEISNINMKTVGFNNYREVSEDDEDANSVLALWYKREQDFSTKMDKSLSTYLFSQLINYIK